MKTIIDIFTGFIDIAIDEKGVYPHPVIGVDKEGKLTMCSVVVGVNPYLVARKLISDGNVSVILGIDRLWKDGQGVELKDFLAVAYWSVEQGWFAGVLEYQNVPRIVKPINWANKTWDALVRMELNRSGIAVDSFGILDAPVARVLPDNNDQKEPQQKC